MICHALVMDCEITPAQQMRSPSGGGCFLADVTHQFRRDKVSQQSQAIRIFFGRDYTLLSLVYVHQRNRSVAASPTASI